MNRIEGSTGMDAIRRSILAGEVASENPHAIACLFALAEGADQDVGHQWLDLDDTLELLHGLGIRGLALSMLWMWVDESADDLRLVLLAVNEGHLPLHKLRDAASGLPVDLELPRLRQAAA